MIVVGIAGGLVVTALADDAVRSAGDDGHLPAAAARRDGAAAGLYLKLAEARRGIMRARP